MAVAETVNSDSAASSGSVVAKLWRGWREKRQRERARQRAHVRFRLTREGVHFVGILLFIFIGAVIRDISLLILLAGAMIGLLLLQWRFNTSTLVGLQVARRVPRNTSVNKETDVEVQLTNLKSWLAAWLVLVEDRVQKRLPDRKRIQPRATALVDAVRPRGLSQTAYRLSFHERGEYHVGPTTLSTRFPLGLGRGWRTVDNAADIIVHPAQGALTAKASELFYVDQLGQAKSSSHAGTQEGDFFGLRPWATGDSRRWIHWRTTARLGQLSVRQFEQQQKRQISVLLDLYDSDAEDAAQHVEQAISFVATLSSQTVKHGRDKLAVTVAAKRVANFPNILSPLLVNGLLDELATAEADSQPDLGQAIRGLSMPLLMNPYLLVVSTRPEVSFKLIDTEHDSASDRLLSAIRVRWLDVSKGDLEAYFQWT